MIVKIHDYCIAWRKSSIALFVIRDKQRFISEILNVIGPLGEKFEFFIPVGTQIERIFIT